MNIEVKQHHVELPNTVIDNIHKYIAADLERFDHMIRRVSVSVADINGPHGGEDKSCRIQIYLKRASSVIVEDRGANLFEVIGRAIARVNMAISRSADRIKGKRRSKAKTFTNKRRVV